MHWRLIYLNYYFGIHGCAQGRARSTAFVHKLIINLQIFFQPLSLSYPLPMSFGLFSSCRLFASEQLKVASRPLPCRHSQETGEVSSETVQLLFKKSFFSFFFWQLYAFNGKLVEYNPFLLMLLSVRRRRWGGDSTHEELKQATTCYNIE